MSISGRYITIRGGNIVGTPPLPPPTPPDPDATAFLTAAGITDPTISSAIDTLVKDLKADSLWDKMQAIYPFVGGTATTHKWNLKNPIDSDVAFRLNFIGGWTHTSNGIQGNGTNAYADTFYVQDTHLPSVNDHHISIYSRSNISEANATEMGVRDNGRNSRTYAVISRDLATSFYVVTNNTFITYSDTSSLGHTISNRTASNLYNSYRNGLLASSNTTVSTQKSRYKFYINTASLENVPQFNAYGTKQFAFATIGLGLSDAGALNFYTAIQTFQTTLGRNV
jgi:hypothetical protein